MISGDFETLNRLRGDSDLIVVGRSCLRRLGVCEYSGLTRMCRSSSATLACVELDVHTTGKRRRGKKDFWGLHVGLLTPLGDQVWWRDSEDCVLDLVMGFWGCSQSLSGYLF